MHERGTWFFYLTSCEAVPFLFAFMIILVTCIVISRRGRKFGDEHAVLQVTSSSKDEPTNASFSQASDTPALQGHEQHDEDIMKKEA